MSQLEVLKDQKQEIKFWIDCLSSDRLTEESIKLINQGLQNEINVYLSPMKLSLAHGLSKVKE